MRTTFNTPIIDTDCPDDMKISTCPLRKFIKSDQEVFYVSANETLLKQKLFDMQKFVETIKQMRAICNKCKEEKTK